jgi:GTP-binding protein
LDFKYRRHFRAEDGKHGGSNKKTGENGKDYVIAVPIGTIVRDANNRYFLGDLDEDSKTLVVAKGGAGGSGNIHVPLATEGEKSAQFDLELELKLVSDVGIIGFPNVGKSSLIGCISNAKSKIADYPFTTKSPVLGVVDFEDLRIVAADMPGLIKDAHKGKGLGLEFLRHISRSKILLHVIDMSGQEGRNPYQDYQDLNKELKLYDESLFKKPQLIIANKMDLPASADNLRTFLSKVKKKVIPASCLNQDGIENIKEEMQGLVMSLR